jgi:S1-C subfamily serine protease
MLIASFAGATPAQVAARGEFAGSWEYLLDEAIFTTPPHPAWSGAALVNREGRLIGIGSLILSDAGGTGEAGNMFVPIDRLAPILGDLIAQGHPAAPPRPWLGITTNEIAGRLLVGAVAPGGPAEKAGVRKGDIVAGVGGIMTKTLAEFYRRVWASGAAGAVVRLDIMREGEPRRLDVTSMNRLDHLRLKSTF